MKRKRVSKAIVHQPGAQLYERFVETIKEHPDRADQGRPCSGDEVRLLSFVLYGQRGVPSVVCHIPAIPTETFDFIITAARHRSIHDLPLAA